MSKAAIHVRVNLRKTHPFLFSLILLVGLGQIAWGLNYWFARPPTFNPFGIDRYIVGTVFGVLGAAQIFLLIVHRSLPKLRTILAVSGFALFAWGSINTRQAFAGKASFALPIGFVVAAIVQWRSLVEAPVNPMTEKK